MDKVIKANFKKGESTVVIRKKMSRCDYGQILQVEGLTLLDGNIEVHFSLTEYEGDANVYIGTVKDNILTVDIPDFIFQKEEARQSTYDAYAFIYQTDGESGRTIKKIVFTINARPNPTTDVPEDKKDPFLDEVRKVMAETKEIAQSVRNDADAGKFNGKDGESGTGKIDEEQLLQFAIKQTTEKAEFLNIQDSAKYKVLDFGMEGKTEQRTTSGKNWFDISRVTDSNNYVPLVSNQYYSLIWIALPSSGDYIMSWKNLNSTTPYSLKAFTSEQVMIKDTVAENSSATSSKITVEENGFYLRMMNINIADFSKYFGDVQLEPGSSVTEYEPFTNGPSPNPDYPQEIVSAGVLNEETGRYEHKCCVGNKNRWDKDYAKDVNNWKTDKAYAYIPIRVMSGKSISVSYKETLSAGLGFFAAVCKDIDSYYIQNRTYAWLYHNSAPDLNNDNFTVTAESDYVYVAVQNVSETLDSFMENIGNYLQIEIADISTELESHPSQSFTLTSPVPLTKWDKLVKRDGVWGWSVWSKHSLFDSSNSTWNIYRAGNDGIYTYYSTITSKEFGLQTSLCTAFKNEDNPHGAGAYRDYSTNAWVIFYTDKATTKDEWLAYIDENPLDMWYKTSEEQSFYPLPDEEQELLNNLETYYGVTNVYNEQGCPMWIKYVADTKLYVDKKLLEIQSAMI